MSNSVISFDFEQEKSKNNHVNVNNVQNINSNFNEMTNNQNEEVFKNFKYPGEWPPRSLSIREGDIIIEKKSM